MINNQKLNHYKILEHCIACTTCSSMAPNVFKLDLMNQIAIVEKQPHHAQDDKKSFSALKSCPVSAIGILKQ